MFSKLRTRLAVIYAALFGAVLACIALAVSVAVDGQARRVVRGEMEAAASVFDRLWELREGQLSDSASILSGDFGFRAAVATQDDPTILSALDNLKDRFGLDVAFVAGVDGAMVGLDSEAAPAGFTDMLRQTAAARGVLTLDGRPHHAVAAPVRAPTLVGWVVFAEALGAEEMSAFSELSSIPLHVDLLATSQLPDNLPADVGPTADGAAMASVLPLDAFGGGSEASLVLTYPMEEALAPYRTLLDWVLLLGAAGLAVLVAATWLVARGVTRPIHALEEAAVRLAKGETSVVPDQGRDEIGRLARSFNAMSGEIAARESRIRQMALQDVETSLPNRHALERALEGASASEPRERIYAAAIGIDRFQHIRSAIGYALSARLMTEVARRLEAAAPGAHFGRLTTDSFGAVFTADTRGEAETLVSRLAAAANRHVMLGADAIDIMATVGLACDADSWSSPLSLLECASVAVDQARGKRARIGVFDQDAYGDPTRTLAMMSGLISGLDKGDVFLAYQPKHDFRAGCVASAEALLRWNDAEMGAIRPDVFIALAEETGHIAPLTDWVLERAISDQAALREAGIDIEISINISGRLITDRRFASLAVKRIKESGARLCFEITETEVIDNPDVALELIGELREAGIAISIDDYGAGLSSLSYLRSIPAQELKIDKEFILNVDRNSADSLLVKSTIDLAHSLGMKVTAEGVETAEAMALLAGMGADLAQGWHIAKPMPLEDFTGWMQTQSAAAPAGADMAGAPVERAAKSG